MLLLTSNMRSPFTYPPAIAQLAGKTQLKPIAVNIFSGFVQHDDI